MEFNEEMDSLDVRVVKVPHQQRVDDEYSATFKGQILSVPLP